MHTITIFSKSAGFLTSYCSYNNLPIIYKFKCEKNPIKVSTLCNNISQEVNYLQSIVSRKAVPVVNGFAFHFCWIAEKIWYMHYSWNYWYNVEISIIKLTKQAENTFFLFCSTPLICVGNFRRSDELKVFFFTLFLTQSKIILVILHIFFYLKHFL